MKNLDGLMFEDREGTVNMLTILYISKLKTIKMYIHSLAIFVIASLLIAFVCTDLKTSLTFIFMLSIFVIAGSYLIYKSHKEAAGLKLLIETYS